MTIENEKGLFGLRPIVWLAIFGAFVVWAIYRGYIKWNGPRPMAMVQNVAHDTTRSVKKLVK